MAQGDAFVQALLGAMPTPHARIALASELQKWQGLTLYLPIEPKAARRRRQAEHMLSNHMAREDVAAELKRRFQTSMRTAQRDVDKALRNLSRSDVAIGK